MLGEEGELGAGQRPIVGRVIVVVSPGHGNHSMALGLGPGPTPTVAAWSAFYRCRPAQVYDPRLCRLAGHKLRDVRAPARQGAAPFLKVERLVVDAGDTALVAAGMAENDLDHVWGDA